MSNRYELDFIVVDGVNFTATLAVKIRFEIDCQITDRLFLHTTGEGFPRFLPVLTNFILHTLIRPKRITIRVVNTLVV